MCGGYYKNFDYPKPFVKINGEKLIDRTIRLLKNYGADIKVCCNMEETAFEDYDLIHCKFTYSHTEQKGYYLDIFDQVPFDEECIFLFGDVFYTEEAILRIIARFNETRRNIFICNQYPFNDQHRREGEPFGWIVKDIDEFRWAVKLCKKFQDRGIITNYEMIPTNWELAHLINGLGVNDFCLRKKDCLVIADDTIDVDDPSVINSVEQRVRETQAA